jgi:hypothetical protein
MLQDVRDEAKESRPNCGIEKTLDVREVLAEEGRGGLVRVPFNPSTAAGLNWVG